MSADHPDERRQDAPLTVTDLISGDSWSARIAEATRQTSVAGRVLGLNGVAPLTTEQREAIAARAHQDRVTTAAAQGSLAALEEPVARAVLELHKPNEYGECEGCDYAGFDGEPPAYPCSTVELIAELHNIPMPNEWRHS